MAAEQGARVVSFSLDGDFVVALDDKGQTYRTRRGAFDWHPDPPRSDPSRPSTPKRERHERAGRNSIIL